MFIKSIFDIFRLTWISLVYLWINLIFDKFGLDTDYRIGTKRRLKYTFLKRRKDMTYIAQLFYRSLSVYLRNQIYFNIYMINLIYLILKKYI
jgi:hypothetical protein